MYNLIVKYTAWQPNKDTIPCERVFEYTGEAIAAHFALKSPKGADRVSELPTLFMEENGEARVGRILRIRAVGKNYELHYTYDHNVQPISASEVTEMASELQIGDWEVSRTHWAIKEVDLYRVLFTRSQGTMLQPKVFDLSSGPLDGKLIAVMMPFAAEFDNVYATLQVAAKDVHKTCQRADDIWKHDAVIQDIVSLICTSSVVICDITGRNPNVFYEAGIAHTIGKNVILITQSDNDVPFNLQHLRYVKYLNNSEGLEKLRAQVVGRVKTIDATFRSQ